jgi:hypothetical protein
MGEQFSSQDDARRSVGIATRQRIRMLGKFTPEYRRPLSEKLLSFLSDLISELSRQMFASQPGNAMCKNYGHVINKSWTGQIPTCYECGAKVHSKTELRRSNIERPDGSRLFWKYNESGKLVQVDAVS